MPSGEHGDQQGKMDNGRYNYNGGKTLRDNLMREGEERDKKGGKWQALGFSTVQYSAVQGSSAQCSAVQCRAVQCSAV